MRSRSILYTFYALIFSGLTDLDATTTIRSEDVVLGPSVPASVNAFRPIDRPSPPEGVVIPYREIMPYRSSENKDSGVADISTMSAGTSLPVPPGKASNQVLSLLLENLGWTKNMKQLPPLLGMFLLGIGVVKQGWGQVAVNVVELASLEIESTVTVILGTKARVSPTLAPCQPAPLDQLIDPDANKYRSKYSHSQAAWVVVLYRRLFIVDRSPIDF